MIKIIVLAIMLYTIKTTYKEKLFSNKEIFKSFMECCTIMNTNEYNIPNYIQIVLNMRKPFSRKDSIKLTSYSVAKTAL